MFQRVIYSLYSRSQSARPPLTESLRQTISDAVTSVNFNRCSMIILACTALQRSVDYLLQFGYLLYVINIQSILITKIIKANQSHRFYILNTVTLLNR